MAGLESDQRMNVIVISAYDRRERIFAANCAAEVSVQVRSNFFNQNRSTTAGRKDKMRIQLVESDTWGLRPRLPSGTATRFISCDLSREAATEYAGAKSA
jgi:hypothetical protein